MKPIFEGRQNRSATESIPNQLKTPFSQRWNKKSLTNEKRFLSFKSKRPDTRKKKTHRTSRIKSFCSIDEEEQKIYQLRWRILPDRHQIPRNHSQNYIKLRSKSNLSPLSTKNTQDFEDSFKPETGELGFKYTQKKNLEGQMKISSPQTTRKHPTRNPGLTHSFHIFSNIFNNDGLKHYLWGILGGRLWILGERERGRRGMEGIGREKRTERSPFLPFL